MMLSMNKWPNGEHITRGASPDYLWEPSVISVDGVTIQHVYALDTEKGWVMAYEDSAPFAFDSIALKTITGVVEYVRLDASDQ
jgi:hypothetical protein